MSRVLIVGYGNPLRSDDGFGYLAAERLRVAVTNPELDIHPIHQLTPELMEPLSRAARAIFIDAAAGGEPGELRCVVLSPEPASSSAFTHFATPQGLLAGALAIYGRAPQAVLYSVAGESFELGEGLSPRVAKALEELLAALTSTCRTA